MEVKSLNRYDTYDLHERNNDRLTWKKDQLPTQNNSGSGGYPGPSNNAPEYVSPSLKIVFGSDTDVVCNT